MAVAFLLLNAPTGVMSQEGCVVCNQDQECEPWDPQSILPPGSTCESHFWMGQMWCQWETDWDCDPEQPLSALLVTAAGTYSAPQGTDRNGVLSIPCTGFLIGHAAAGPVERKAGPLVLTL